MSEERLKKYSMLLLCNLILHKSGKLNLEEYEKIKAELKREYENS